MKITEKQTDIGNELLDKLRFKAANEFYQQNLKRKQELKEILEENERLDKALEETEKKFRKLFHEYCKKINIHGKKRAKVLRQMRYITKGFVSGEVSKLMCRKMDKLFEYAESNS